MCGIGEGGGGGVGVGGGMSNYIKQKFAVYVSVEGVGC